MPDMLGENDEYFRFCQYCGHERATGLVPNIGAPLKVDEQAITSRYLEFKEMWEAKASQRSRCAARILFTKFLTVEENGQKDLHQRVTA